MFLLYILEREDCVSPPQNPQPKTPLTDRIRNSLLSVPVRVKVLGIAIFPVILMGLAFNYWVWTGLPGWLSLFLPPLAAESVMEAGSRTIFLISLLVTATSILVASFLTYILTQPILELRDMANQVAQGKLKMRAHAWAADEIGELSESINQMVDKLVTSQDDLKIRNRQLLALNRIAMAAASQDEIHDVLYRVLSGVVEILNINMGWIYLYNPERGRFHLASWYGVAPSLQQKLLDTKAVCQCQTHATQDGWQPRNGPVECERFKQWGIQHRITPLYSRAGLPLGIMLLACQQPHTFIEEDLKLLDLIGAQVSEIVSNAWLQIKLKEKEKNRRKLLQALVTAQEDERTRLARELHDGAGQALTSLLIRTKMIEDEMGDGSLKVKVGDLCADTSNCIEYVRDISHQLRPAALEEIGLIQAINNLAERTAAEGDMQSTVEICTGRLHLPDEIEVTVYRIFQEGLTNILRHSHATHFRVCLTRQENFLVVEVEDDGLGFDPKAVKPIGIDQHLGILGMRERVVLLGGSLEVRSQKGAGTYIRGELPLLDNNGNGWPK